MAEIEITGLRKQFASTLAVDDLSFEAHKGAVTGFLGPNGAGKTTTLRMLLGLVQPDSGTATIHGRRYVDLDAPTREVGSLLEASSFHPARTARNHLRMIAAVEDLPDERIDEVLGMIGLTGVAGKKVRTFSMGMRQRLGLAVALLGDPGVLVLDEPANGLDPEGIRWLRELLRYLADEGRTILVSSHVLSEVGQVADRVVIIGRGRLLADETLEELTQRSAPLVRVRSPQADRLREVLLAGPTGAGEIQVETRADGALAVGGTEAAAVGELASKEGIVLHELVEERSTLEQVFFELTEGATPHAAAPLPAADGALPGPGAHEQVEHPNPGGAA